MKGVDRSLKSFVGEILYNVNMGTIQWKRFENQGREFTFCILNSYYFSDRKRELFFSQQRASIKMTIKLKDQKKQRYLLPDNYSVTYDILPTYIIG